MKNFFAILNSKIKINWNKKSLWTYGIITYDLVTHRYISVGKIFIDLEEYL